MQKKRMNNARAFHTEDTYISMEVTLPKYPFYLLQLLRDYLTRLDGRIFLLNHTREFHNESRRGTPSIVQPVLFDFRRNLL